ncbi:MAG: hydrogenase maturation protein [Gammaproteobacteria bacterium]|uniref:enoyl-CoA hydratase-related protein n=1 Tax=Hydrogenophaga sp. TaxID=1904254 RepID=UPI0025BA433E|nr:enoyl-CoA hydratase-related protein [Hydrogenophaga sp.]MBU4181233.1 hydrogenase maturation protein [Gammaproteobacteria bacterium]MBU4281405.1 hydrogenase maturation protein [Gammaproteobacteria bacterium]MBU4325738.1 hydrogenase maturation protein [Gammaproteobacteria bacterium]MCG2654870.1 enoyl-CoA hydratase-related protein [Hydrogenophaga sp.]
MNPLRILLLCHSFNSLTQRLFAELRAAGHTLSVELDIADSVTEEAVALFRPDLVLAPFLKRRIPATVWERVTCLVVHPGPPGDQGPSALDWAVWRREPRWGVTVLQANGDFDAGPVWAHAHFPLREATKGSLYRREVTQAALQATLAAVQRFAGGEREAPAWTDGAPLVRWQPLLRQNERAVHWAEDSTATVLAKLRSGDGQPGVLDALWGQPCYLGDAHPASVATMAGFPQATPGALLAVRDGALLRSTVDGGVWIGQARRADPPGTPPAQGSFKQVAAELFASEAATLQQCPVPLERAPDEWGELRYAEHGPEGARVGCLSFDFYNGAMSTARCERLRAALLQVRERPTQVLLLLGGEGFFSNGIDLNSIEAAAHRAGDSAANASWRNIQAMNDVALGVLQTTDRLTVSVLRGNAGAGGAFLALAADQVWAHGSVVLNPHYKNMGNLYGSEYWTYLLPRRLGEGGAKALMAQRLPLLAAEALKIGLIDHNDEGPREGFEERCLERALALAGSYNQSGALAAQQARREQDEALRPLAHYREQELARMHRNFYGFDPSYHVARHHFVHKQPHAWTPRHLAVHRL